MAIFILMSLLKESSTTPPDSFGLGAAIASANAANVLNACPLAWIAIPNLSQDGITPLTASSNTVTTGAWQSQACGTNFGIEQTGSAIASPLVCKLYVRVAVRSIGVDGSFSGGGQPLRPAKIQSFPKNFSCQGGQVSQFCSARLLYQATQPSCSANWQKCQING